jgi:hypothetical protein
MLKKQSRHRNFKRDYYDYEKTQGIIRRQNCHYGWEHMLISYKLQGINQKKDKWNWSLHWFHELPEVVQELSIVQIHVGIKIWTLDQGNITIDIQELIK